MRWHLEDDPFELERRNKRFEDSRYDPGNIDNLASNLFPQIFENTVRKASGGSGGGGMPMSLPGTSMPAPTVPGASTAGKLGMGFFSKGLDPTALLLGGLSMLGGDPSPFQERTSFRGTGADPVKQMEGFHQALMGFGQSLADRHPVRLRSSVVPQGPAPVSIPGVPFQIGGGLGVDPALRNPSLLEGDNSWMERFRQVIDSIGGGAGGGRSSQPPQKAKRRNPNG